MEIEQGAIEQLKRIAAALGYQDIQPDSNDPRQWFLEPGHKLLDDAIIDLTWPEGDTDD